MIVFHWFSTDLPPGWDEANFVPTGDYDIIGTLVREHVAQELNKTETEEFLLQTQVVNTHKWGKYVETVLQTVSDNQYTGSLKL